MGAEPSQLAADERGHGLEASVAEMVVTAEPEIRERAGDRVGCREEAVQRDEASEGGAEPTEPEANAAEEQHGIAWLPLGG